MTKASGKRRITGVLLVVVFVAVIGVIVWPKIGAFLETAVTRDIESGPLLVRDASGEAVLATLLTYDQPRWSRSGTARGTRQVIELQLNRMADAADLGRAVIRTTTQSGNLDLYLLGAEPDRVWIYAEGLYAVSISQRALELAPSDIESRVPQLRGQLPDDRKFYELDGDGGLRVTARDGSRFLLNTRTWALGPQPETTPTPAPRDTQEWQRALAHWSARNDEATATTFAHRPGEYGLDSWRSGDRWLGMLSGTEQRDYSRNWHWPRSQRLDPERRKICTASAQTTDGDRTQLGELRALGDKTYLRGGFLRDGRKLRPVQPKDSEDLIVEHYTAIDDSAQTLLTRITPAGEERWTTTLPLKYPNTITATAEHVAFRGLRPKMTYVNRALLVCVSLADGKVSTFEYN